MNNTWNRFIYKVWSPLYDRFFNSGQFLKARKRIFEDIRFISSQKVLFVGVGTGADLTLIDHENLQITAIDYSPDMLAQARKKFSGSSIEFLEMDAQNMTFEAGQFDVVVGSLILSVVPDAERCFKEMIRVLKDDGQIVIFDKFASKEKELSLGKKLIRPIIKVLGTDIGLNFERLFNKYRYELNLIEDTPVLFGDMYRKILIEKQAL